ncbi:MAG: lysophospholipid acyltransferase family protein [Bacteroidales bacterium]|jgi:putative hemolysin|nr:lysophospholipid acyltransferase family protein [Bacteroidales bacterium]
MKIFSNKEPQDHNSLKVPEGPIIADTLLKIFKYNILNQAYTEFPVKSPVAIVNSLLDHLDLKIEVNSDDLRNIPEKGPFILVANHPYRGIDSMILLKLVSERRSDLRIFASYLLHSIDPLKELIIPVNTYESKDKGKSSLSGIKEAINYLRDGHPVAIFPTGEQSAQWEVSKIIVDGVWQIPAVKFIKNAGVPVIPVYFHATMPRMHYIMGMIHPLLRTSKLPSEILKKKNRVIRVRLGSPLTVNEQQAFCDTEQFGRYLRARIYSLGSAIEVKKYFDYITLRRKPKPEPIADPVDNDILAAEFESVKEEYGLFSTKNYYAVCAPASAIPNIFNEIGRLREVTFRNAGEGTNKSVDIDGYDFYFYHLFIWDTEIKRLVGAYRLGKGNEIMSLYGAGGFYVSSLFRMKKDFHQYLWQSLELGRSFITVEYQRKAIPLFLLWKGIMVFLLRNTEYRYLLGPVSISNDFSQFSKSLIVEFFRRNYMRNDLADMISPRMEFTVKNTGSADMSVIIDAAGNDLGKIEKIITDSEPGNRFPVLLKKYLELNGRILAFNIDPEFNYCLDGLMLLDVYDVPLEALQGLSREMSDPDILDRFNK